MINFFFRSLFCYLSSVKRVILFISISYFCEFSHISVPAMYDFGEGKGQGSNDMEKYKWDLSWLFQLQHGKKTFKLDFATVVDDYNDSDIIL